jgi:steroid 5-alpha reductase family enzyme
MVELFSIIQLSVLAWGLVFLLMSLIYGVSRLINNAGIVDIFWAFGFSVLISLYLIYTDGVWLHKILLSSMVYIASARLTLHIIKRFIKEYPKEDPRYTAFKVQWHPHPEWMTFWVFQLQGLLMIWVSLPFLLACQNPFPGIQLTEWIAVLLFGIAFLGETLADWQLQQFKSNSLNTKKTCQSGLWYYSRHPNYFFQWLLWVSFALFSWQAPWGFLGIISPALMLHFLMNVTGIKATEAHAIKSRTDYAQYQKTTSPFIPWFPKKQIR